MESKKTYIEYKREIQKELSVLKQKLSKHHSISTKKQFDWPEVSDLSLLLSKLKQVNQSLSV
ncbi:MAG TPA: hypothetical protein VK835_15175 [Bacteroidia bacterium]|jgi:hypothetical protein|nr:hypothetical protein [Bacteroidia bacterium]